MGEKTVNRAWIKRVDEVVREIEKKFCVEALIVFGSWSRSGGGEWSDLDLLIVTEGVRGTNPLDRFTVSAELRKYGVDVFFYTFEELESMTLKGNPLALSALIDGIILRASPRTYELRERTKNTYTRRGRTWIRVHNNTSL